MGDLYLTPISIPLLAKLLLSTIITIYIVLFISKNKTVNWFCGYLVGYSLLDLFAFLGQTIHADWAVLNLPFQYLASFLMAFSFLQFSYFFKESLFKIEQRRVQKLVGFLALICTVIVVYIISAKGYGDYTSIKLFAIYPVLCLIWATVVFFRKYLVAKKAESTSKNAYLSFFIISTLSIIISFSVVIDAIGLISPIQNMIVFFVFNLVIISLLTTNFINYLAEKTTVLVKIVGLSLVLFITIIGLQGFLVMPDFEQGRSVQGSLLSEADLQMAHNQAEPYAWFLIGAIIFIVIIFPFFFNKSVLSPLKTLLDGVDEVNRGNLKVSIPVVNQDEIGVVTRHFNAMTSNLEKANSALKDYAEQLEKKVKNRTKQLNSQNITLENINRKLEKQTQELERLDQFRSKLFMNISHELRTPLTLISGPIESLLTQTALPNAVEQKLKISLRNSNRLKQLVEQILDLNRLDSEQLVLHISELDVSETVTFYINSFQSLFKYNNISFVSNIPEVLPKLYVDSDKFEKVLTNLITNAVKFTPQGGSITLNITCTDQHVIFEFTDTGIGIAPDRLGSIFNRFETSAKISSDYSEGLGLGLAITKEYIELHGGTISAKSELEKGTSFLVTLKQGTEHLNKAIIASDPSICTLNKEYSKDFVNTDHSDLETDTLGNLGQILLVEDNFDMGNYIGSILQEEGYKVSVAENGKVALAHLKTFKPDLVISDIMMPVMDGMAFMKELKNIDAFKNLPTIFLSARSDQEGLIDSLKIGVNDYLVKPFHTVELLCRVENLLEFSQSRQEFLIELAEENHSSVDQHFIEKLTKLVEERISKTTFNVEEFAGELAMSRSTLYREIKKATGFSAAAFVKEIRLQKARQLLEAKAVVRLNELSDSIGFSTPSYFAKMYYKRFGKSPKDYLHS
tara:strand:- start:4148 stop:6880 length:2733 start_codon:yes stop_codon:yes gene_type:complete